MHIGVQVANGHAYVADYSSLMVIDVTTPTVPRAAGRLNTLDYNSDVVVADRIAYVVGHKGLAVIDVSVSASPRAVSAIDMPGSYMTSRSRMESPTHRTWTRPFA